MLLLRHIYKYMAGCSKKANSFTDSFKRSWPGQDFFSLFYCNHRPIPCS